MSLEAVKYSEVASPHLLCMLPFIYMYAIVSLYDKWGYFLIKQSIKEV